MGTREGSLEEFVVFILILIVLVFEAITITIGLPTTLTRVTNIDFSVGPLSHIVRIDFST